MQAWRTERREIASGAIFENDMHTVLLCTFLKPYCERASYGGNSQELSLMQTAYEFVA